MSETQVRITQLISQLRTALNAEPAGRSNSIAITKLDECSMWNEQAERDAKARLFTSDK